MERLNSYEYQSDGAVMRRAITLPWPVRGNPAAGVIARRVMPREPERKIAVQRVRGERQEGFSASSAFNAERLCDVDLSLSEALPLCRNNAQIPIKRIQVALRQLIFWKRI